MSKKATNRDKKEAKARKVARVLVDALYTGEMATAKAWKLTRQTVYNYWDLLNEDEDVLQFFTIEKERREKEWASRLNGPIYKALSFFDRVFDEASVTDPESIKAVTEAFSTLVEAKAVSEMINDGFNKSDRKEATTDKSNPTSYNHHSISPGQQPTA